MKIFKKKFEKINMRIFKKFKTYLKTIKNFERLI